MKKLAYAVSVALGMGLAASAHSAVPVSIDPDAGGGATTISVGNLDWAVGNALATGVGTDRALGDQFTLYAQARLSNFNNIANQNIAVPTLNSSFEWTYVTAFQEQITGFANGGQSLQFQVNPNNLGLDATSNFFRIYRSAPDASDLAGTGFSNGSLILEGHILIGNQLGDSGFNIAGNFNSTSGVFTPTTAALDQFGTNNYPGITSITGSGSSAIIVSVDSFDAATFPNLAIGSLFTLDFNTSQILAYNQTDPSACFWSGTALIGGAGGGGCANAIGAVNGVSGPDVIFQTDANNSFTVVQIPEPGVLALFGISLLGLGIARTRRS